MVGCGVLKMQTKTFKKTLTTQEINFKKMNKWKKNYKYGSNEVFQMSQNLQIVNKTRQDAI
jgi:hypothetical protein